MYGMAFFVAVGLTSKSRQRRRSFCPWDRDQDRQERIFERERSGRARRGKTGAIADNDFVTDYNRMINTAAAALLRREQRPAMSGLWQ